MARDLSRRTAVVAILLTIAFVMYADYKSRHTEVPPESWGRVGCRDAVKEQLAAPTTAKIEWVAYGLNPEKSLPYEFAIAGKVTSQNYFGAMLTKDFMCYHNGKQDFRGKVLMAP